LSNSKDQKRYLVFKNVKLLLYTISVKM